MRFHDLRHTWASGLIQPSVPLSFFRKWGAGGRSKWSLEMPTLHLTIYANMHGK
nr:MAG TPA: Telomere resolvase [Caudoviricetes sp.]